MPGRGNVRQKCPCCQAVLTIDLDTGEILMSEEAKTAPALDIAEAAKSLEKEKGKREEAFRQSLEAQKHKEDILEKKFREAMKRAKENPDAAPPPREIDLD
jgi:hypothetical protein